MVDKIGASVLVPVQTTRRLAVSLSANVVFTGRETFRRFASTLRWPETHLESSTV